MLGFLVRGGGLLGYFRGLVLLLGLLLGLCLGMLRGAWWWLEGRSRLLLLLLLLLLGLIAGAGLRRRRGDGDGGCGMSRVFDLDVMFAVVDAVCRSSRAVLSVPWLSLSYLCPSNLEYPLHLHPLPLPQP